MLTVEQAWELIAREVVPSDTKNVPLAEALGCVLADDVASTTDSPPFDKAMMDGYAVRSQDLQEERTELSIIDEVLAGATPSVAVGAGTATRIMTGAPVPQGADAVIPVEWTSCQQDRVTLTRKHSITPGWNILPQGELMKTGEPILSAGTRLRAQEIALLAETGHAHPLVRIPPTVAILATGDELVDVDQTPGPGQIRNSNAIMLAAQVQQAGAIPRVLGIARDNRDDLHAKIQSGLECDFLCLSGGVSAGQADLVPSELRALGVEEIFHKVAMKPGKPLWFGQRRSTEERRPAYVFGLPGNPVSSMVCFELFVRLALRRHVGCTAASPVLIRAKLDGEFESRGDRHVWFPSTIRLEESGLRVRPTGWKGSADLRATSEANCSLSVPPGEHRWAAETSVEVLPWGTTLEI